MQGPTFNYKDLLESVPCNICGSTECDIVYPARYERGPKTREALVESFKSSGKDILVDPLVRCKSCKLEYLTPRLRQDVIIDAYSAGSDEDFVSQVSAREKTFARSLAVLEKHLPTKGKILDIGSAGGSFLKAAKDRGWTVFGCEPNRWLTEWCRQNYKIDLFAGTLFDMRNADATYDCVALWDVLEHVPDPVAVLQECRRILKPNGILVVNYPNIGSLVARGMGRRWVFLLTVHLYYFTPETIRAILAKTGFEMIDHRIHFQWLEFDYILYRMEAYIRVIPRLMRKLAKALGCSKLQIPYTVGQSLALGRKTA